MFKDTFLDDRAESRRPWTVAVSLLAQCLAIAVAILASLLTAGDLPARKWMAHLLAPPPMPPAARAPEPARVVPAQTPAPPFDESALVTPVAIPEEVALIVEAPVQAPVGAGVSGVATVPGSIGTATDHVLAQLAAPRASVAPPPKPEPKPRTPREPVRVSSDLQEARIIRRVTPVYPSLARQARISGVVQLEAVIGEDGTIRELRVLSGHPLLVPSARDAVRQWRYRPTLLGGVAVPVLTRIDVNFKLGR